MTGLAALVAADAVLLVHLAFIVFVVAGGLLVIRFPRLAWLHVPAALWGGIVEAAGLTCPLTPLENMLRVRAGGSAYGAGCIEHYVAALIYPAGLTRAMQALLAAAVVAINTAVYGIVLARRRRKGVTRAS